VAWPRATKITLTPISLSSNHKANTEHYMSKIHTLLRVARITVISLSINLGVVAGAACILVLVWNKTLVGLGNLPALGYVRAIGILAVIKILNMVARGVTLNVSLEE